MKGTKLYRDFVPQNEYFFISMNRSYWTFEGRR